MRWRVSRTRAAWLRIWISKNGVEWFEINYNVSAEHTAALEQWADDEGLGLADLPDYLWQYQTAAPEEEEEEEGGDD